MKISKKQIVTISCIAVCFILSLIFDKQIINAIQLIRNPFLDLMFSGILFIENWFIFYPLIILLTAAILAWKNKQAILPFIISAGIAALITFLLKNIIARPRPLTLEPESFPSGHSTFAFTPLAFLSKLKLISIIWLVFACLLSFTRLWFGLHYLSDLIAGAVIGYCTALVIKKIVKLK